MVKIIKKNTIKLLFIFEKEKKRKENKRKEKKDENLIMKY